jgi:hypothetical protein
MRTLTTVVAALVLAVVAALSPLKPGIGRDTPRGWECIERGLPGPYDFECRRPARRIGAILQD